MTYFPRPRICNLLSTIKPSLLPILLVNLEDVQFWRALPWGLPSSNVDSYSPEAKNEALSLLKWP